MSANWIVFDNLAVNLDLIRRIDSDPFKGWLYLDEIMVKGDLASLLALIPYQIYSARGD
jgi:hypothetical protein